MRTLQVDHSHDHSNAVSKFISNERLSKERESDEKFQKALKYFKQKPYHLRDKK